MAAAWGWLGVCLSMTENFVPKEVTVRMDMRHSGSTYRRGIGQSFRDNSVGEMKLELGVSV